MNLNVDTNIALRLLDIIQDLERKNEVFRQIKALGQTSVVGCLTPPILQELFNELLLSIEDQVLLNERPPNLTYYEFWQTLSRVERKSRIIEANNTFKVKYGYCFHLRNLTCQIDGTTINVHLAPAYGQLDPMIALIGRATPFREYMARGGTISRYKKISWADYHLLIKEKKDPLTADRDLCAVLEQLKVLDPKSFTQRAVQLVRW